MKAAPPKSDDEGLDNELLELDVRFSSREPDCAGKNSMFFW